jgi:2-phosphosulfolactate phosphatase
LRNARAQAKHLLAEGRDVVVLGADSRGEFREEDQLCAARVAGALARGGYEKIGSSTARVMERFGDAPDDAFIGGRSAAYLRDTGQGHDLSFVLEHVDDLDAVFAIEQGEVRALPGPR